jgi:hypothetical protein
MDNDVKYCKFYPGGICICKAGTCSLEPKGFTKCQYLKRCKKGVSVIKLRACIAT